MTVNATQLIDKVDDAIASFSGCDLLPPGREWPKDSLPRPANDPTAPVSFGFWELADEEQERVTSTRLHARGSVEILVAVERDGGGETFQSHLHSLSGLFRAASAQDDIYFGDLEVSEVDVDDAWEYRRIRQQYIRYEAVT